MKAWRCTIIALLVLVPSLASASVLRSIHERPHGGFVGRFNLAQLDWRTGPEVNSRPIAAYSVGGFLVLPATRSFSVQVEAVYTRKGTETRLRDLGGVQVSALHLDYVELAPLAQLSLPLDSELRVFGEFGPVFGINVGGNFTEFHADGRSSSTDALSGLELFELGVAAGAGISVPMEGLGLLFGVRHHWGLTSISRQPETLLTRNFQIQTGLYF